MFDEIRYNLEEKIESIPKPVFYGVGFVAGLFAGYMVFSKLPSMIKEPELPRIEYVPTRCRECEDKQKANSYSIPNIEMGRIEDGKLVIPIDSQD